MLEGTELQKFSAAPELQKIKDKIDHTSEWIWDEGETAPTKDLRTKRTDLESVQPLFSLGLALNFGLQENGAGNHKPKVRVRIPTITCVSHAHRPRPSFEFL